MFEQGISTLAEQIGVRVTRKNPRAAGADQGYDGEAALFFEKDKPTRVYIEVKGAVRLYQVEGLIKQQKQHHPLVVVTDYVEPKAKEQLRRNGVGYVETTGNMFLKFPGQFVFIEGKKSTEPLKETNRAFTKTGLKVIFLFLQDDTLITQPYRTIAAVAGVGLGNVNHIMNGLKALKLAVLRGNGEYFIPDKRRLLERWLEGYEQRLKPTLHLGTFRFVNREDFFHWRDLKLETNNTAWGGEPAGDILTDYLNPETLTLYTEESKADIMKRMRIMPDAEGNVEVYKKFWISPPTVTAPIVPPLLVYTDLMNTGKQRCIDTAQKIYEQELKDKFQ